MNPQQVGVSENPSSALPGKNESKDLDSAEAIYQSLLTRYTEKANSLKMQLGWLSFIRLLLFIGFIFLAFKSVQTGASYFIVPAIISLFGFLLFIRLYDKLQSQAAFYSELAKLSRNEINFLNGLPSVYPDGAEYIDPHHSYSYDLDLFGEGGLFPYLNRTSTVFGKNALANSLLHPNKTVISQRQKAIEELSDQLEFRQHLQAHGSLLDTKEKELRQLKAWLSAKPAFTNKAAYMVLMIFPLTTVRRTVYWLPQIIRFLVSPQGSTP